MINSTNSRLRDSTRFTLGLLFLTLCATVVPFWITTVPPSTDLPQHLSQIYLLEQTLAGERADLIVTPWFYPNTLVYWLLWGLWKIADPITTGRLVLSAIASTWVLATFMLCSLRKRSIENWLISIPLTFNFLFSWGLLNFLIGWPIFCLFISIASGNRARFQPIWLTIIALLLYYAHALWFVMANVWLLLELIKTKPRSLVSYIVPMIPSWTFALVWYPQLAANRGASGVNTGLLWKEMPFDRLDPELLVDAALGAIHSPLETFFLLFLTLWVTAIVATRWKTIGEDIDKPLFTASLLLGLAFWALPSTYMNTIFFNARWLPCSLVLLLLSLPTPSLNKALQIGIGLLFLALFSVTTVLAWRNWEREEFDGLISAIIMISSSDRIMGMDLYAGSLYVKGRPGLQAFSWAQVLRGCKINFSFAEHYSGAVQYRVTPAPNPTRNKVWSPAKTSRKDLQDIDLVLINADQRTQDLMRERLDLYPAGEHAAISDGNGAWRLYHVRIPTPRQ